MGIPRRGRDGSPVSRPQSESTRARDFLRAGAMNLLPGRGKDRKGIPSLSFFKTFKGLLSFFKGLFKGLLPSYKACLRDSYHFFFRLFQGIPILF